MVNSYMELVRLGRSNMAFVTTAFMPENVWIGDSMSIRGKNSL
jgi:hypothetical protein